MRRLSAAIRPGIRSLFPAFACSASFSVFFFGVDFFFCRDLFFGRLRAFFPSLQLVFIFLADVFVFVFCLGHSLSFKNGVSEVRRNNVECQVTGVYQTIARA